MDGEVNMRTSHILRSAVWGLLALALLVGVACSSDDNGKTSDDASVSAAPRTTATIVATDNKFDTAKLTVPANQPVTVTFQNRGQAIHNWHVLDIKDVDSKNIATQLLPAGQSETVTFALAVPGTYAFHCDTHPAEMKGSLTVQ
jgi:plastocyanin